MFLNIINEIESALQHKLFHCALAMALTLPDICGKVEFPNENSSQRYRKWFEQHVEFPLRGYYEGNPVAFNSFACWQLRCAYLHSGDFDLQKEAPAIRVKKFRLFYTSEGEPIKSATYPENDGYTMDFDVRYLCKKICDSARAFYASIENKEAFNIGQIVDRIDNPEVGTIKLYISLSDIPKNGVIAEGVIDLLPAESFTWSDDND